MNEMQKLELNTISIATIQGYTGSELHHVALDAVKLLQLGVRKVVIVFNDTQYEVTERTPYELTEVK